MAANNLEKPLIVIVGPTASGKSGLAIKLAKEFNGEVISADSRAVYTGLDIGTAKPTLGEREGVPHWGFDLATPGERFTAADFQYYARQKIQEIRARGHVPFLVGGTGLYVDSVVYDFQFPHSDGDVERRAALSKWTLESLQEHCTIDNIDLPENSKNKRHVINTILRHGHQPKRRSEPMEHTIVVGITTEKVILQQRIAERTEQIFSPATYREAQQAAVKYGWDNEAMTGNVYPLLRRYFSGELSLEDAKRTFQTLDWRLAKRQLTWLKRHEHIHWATLDEAYRYIAHLLASLNKK